ncbi:MAG: two-component regulator propeller domain-containing protein [Bacteroidota bacterium]
MIAARILAKPKLWLICILLFSLQYVFAQQFGIRNYSVGDGLAQSQVFAISGDSRGFIWLGTRGGGLSRFDGKEFQNLSSQEGLINNYIWTICEDHKQDIWLGTDNGLSRWDGIRFHNYLLSDSQRVPIYSIVASADANLWIGSGSGLFRYTNDSLYRADGPLAQIEGEVNSLYLDPTGTLWIGQRGKISAWKDGSLTSYGRRQGVPYNRVIWDFCTDADSNLWVATYGSGLLKLTGNRFRSQLSNTEINRGFLFDLHFSQEGELWIATQNAGVGRYNPRDGSFDLLQVEDGLSANYIRKIWEDAWGNLWFGSSGGGLSKYFGQQFKHFDQNSGLPGRAVYSVLEDTDCNIWMGVGANGLARFSGDSLQLFNAANAIANRKVKALHEDRFGRIWAGSDGGGLSVYLDSNVVSLSIANGLGDNWIRDIEETADGSIWLATTGNGLTRIRWPENSPILPRENIAIYNRNRGLPQNHINCLHEDKEARLWFGTSSKGIGYRDRNGKITHLPLEGGFTANQVRAMIEDEYGYLWVGTAGGGLKRLDIYSDSTAIPIKNFAAGFNSTNVYLLGLDERQNLWIGTEKGVERASLDPDRNIIELKAFGRAEGFVGVEVCQNAFYRDKEGHLWFGTVNGLTQYLPEQAQQSSQAPSLSLTNIRLTYEPLSETRFANKIGAWNQPLDTLQFPYDQNHIGFDFLGINHQNPERVRYQWRLEGEEENWSRLSANTSATYSNLEPGLYKFLVRACNPDGTCKEIQAVSFEILPPFWQRWWFILSAIALGITIIALSFRLRINQVRRKAAEERQILEMEKDLLRLEQKSLGLQMNPHFLFNALNSIQALIADNDAKTARYYLAKFAKLMRSVLDNSRNNLIPLQKEIQTLDLYLGIEQFSRDNAFNFTIEVMGDVDPEEVMIPPLLVQPFVENAIIHGVAHRTETGQIDLQFKRSGDYLECRITDDGIGREKAKTIRSQQSHTHKSTGLEVTQERLDILHRGEEGTLESSIQFVDLKHEDGRAAGTQVIVRLPMREEWE